MRALSLTQPWPWIILNLGKDVENRVWTTKHRGPFLLHAAKGYSRAKWMAAYDWVAARVGMDAANVIPEWDEDDVLLRGGIVGVASIHDVVEPCEGWMGNDGCCARRWHMHKQHGFLLRDVRPLPFRPWVGQMRWFNVPDDEATGRALDAMAVARLQEANAFVAERHPLPRCPHGNVVRDHAGDRLEPSCGCPGDP